MSVMKGRQCRSVACDLSCSQIVQLPLFHCRRPFVSTQQAHVNFDLSASCVAVLLRDTLKHTQVIEMWIVDESCTSAGSRN